MTLFNISRESSNGFPEQLCPVCVSARNIRVQAFRMLANSLSHPVFRIIGYASGCEIMSHCSLDCVFQMSSHSRTFFHVPIGHLLPSVE